jgi:cobalt/nickel transport protein
MKRGGTWFYLGFLVVALLLAGVVSYAASPDPDGLDAVTRTGCQFDAADQPIGGQCIAQNAGEHATAGSPLADYTVGGGEGTTGVAGVIGVLVVLAIAGGLFWLLRRRGRAAADASGETVAAGPPSQDG